MATNGKFIYQDVRTHFFKSLVLTLNDEDCSSMEREFQQVSDGMDNERRTTMEQAFRDAFFHLALSNGACAQYIKLVEKAVDFALRDLCSNTTPFIILSDIFDCITLDKCSEIFKFVEDNIFAWKQDKLYGYGKNFLLRMYLLRRLSKSQDTVFCGRIQLFLSRLFPLSEKSGVNLVGNYNVENLTKFNDNVDNFSLNRQSEEVDASHAPAPDSMDVEEGETKDDGQGSIPIDFNLYKKFWSLQSVFNRPMSCYEKNVWKTFTANTEEVLACFDSYKLDQTKTSHRVDNGQTFFAKYLTSEKLLDLQLNDSNFRRYVLTQFLILLHFLHVDSKFKNSQLHTLTDEQSQWTFKTKVKILSLAKQTPPDGERFTKALEHLLEREDFWNTWKNDGCNSFVREKNTADDVSAELKKMYRKRRSFGDDLRLSDGKAIKMGSAELTKLWNICPDNLSACQSELRPRLPALEEYFDDPVEQLDPKNQVEEQYWYIKQPQFQWKALRLLSRQSPHFFIPTAQAHRPLDQYLKESLQKIAKEITPISQDEMDTEAAGDDGEEEQNELREEREVGDDRDLSDAVVETKGGGIPRDLLSKVAADIAHVWKKLAQDLGIDDEMIAFFESDNEEKHAQAEKMLIVWQETNGEEATLARLETSLLSVGQKQTAINVTS